MAYSKQKESNIALQVLGVLLFLLGLALLFVVPVGTIAGLILMIVSARLGFKVVKGWKCPSCGYFYQAQAK